MAARDPARSSAPPPSRSDEEFEEVTLADIVRVLHQRKIVLGSVFLVCMLVGVAFTAFATPQYESQATMIPLEHRDIISNWLDSRRAAGLVVEEMGDRVNSALYPDRWDSQAQAWTGEEPTTQEAGAELAKHVTIEEGSSGVGGTDQRFLAVTVQLSDPVLARLVAEAYVETLDDLRPRLENITRQEAFNRYYEGDNEQQAQRRAEVTAENKDYWIMLDEPLTGEQVSPNAVLNLSLAGVLGLFLGVFGAFFANWIQQFRAETRSVEFPNEESGREPPPGRQPERSDG